MRLQGEVVDGALFRVGTAVLGLFSGFIIGVLVFAPLVVGEWVSTPLTKLLAAGAVAGAVCGAVVPQSALFATEGLAHFVLGGLSGPSSAGEEAGWVGALWWVGALYFGVVWLSLEIYALLTRYSA